MAGTRDAAVLAQLKRAGSDLTQPHPIEFFLYFADEARARRAASMIAAREFAVDVRPQAGGGTDWVVMATRTMLPALDALVELSAFLTATAAAEQGVYDGWGTPVVP